MRFVVAPSPSSSWNLLDLGRLLLPDRSRDFSSQRHRGVFTITRVTVAALPPTTIQYFQHEPHTVRIPIYPAFLRIIPFLGCAGHSHSHAYMHSREATTGWHPTVCVHSIHKSHTLLLEAVVPLDVLKNGTYDTLREVPCCAKADFISLGPVAAFTGRAAASGQHKMRSSPAIVAMSVRGLLFSMLAIYSLNSLSLAAPLLWSIYLSIHLSINATHRFSISRSHPFGLARATGSTCSSLSGAAYTWNPGLQHTYMHTP